MATAVADCLERHVRPGQAVVVALSGGVDSVVLLHALHATTVPLVAMHVHHGLSPNADAWALFCEKTCRGFSVPLTVSRVEVDKHSRSGVECAARTARYGALAKAAGDWLMLGHHAGDQAETVLFNLVRGAGVRGASAMPERRGRMLRPLLGVDRAQILAYASRHELSWIEDESNGELRYSRNFLRHEIVASLRKRFPAVEANFAAAAKRFEEAQELLDDLAVLDLAGHPRDFPVALTVLSAISEPRARNVLRYLLGKRGIQGPGEDRLKETLRQLLTASPDRHPSLTFGEHRLFRRSGKVELVTRQPEALPVRRQT